MRKNGEDNDFLKKEQIEIESTIKKINFLLRWTVKKLEVRIFNVQFWKPKVHERKKTGLWKWFLWLGNSILSIFYLRHLILGSIL